MLAVIITAITMVAKTVSGFSTKSWALLADGIHMGSHVLAIGLSWVAYIIVLKVSANTDFKVNSIMIFSFSECSS